MDRLKAAVHERCRLLHIEPPTPERIDRLIRSAIAEYEREFCEALVSQLSPETQAQLNALLLPTEPLFQDTVDEPGRALLHELRADSGRASLESAQEEIAKLERARSFHLPPDLFAALSPQVLRSYRQRVSAEEPHELRRHPAPLRATLLAAFCRLRGQEITDNLVDLLIETVHHLAANAEQRVERELIEDLKRVSGKNSLLFRMAEAALTHPDGIVREFVFPVIDEQALGDLVKEWKATGPIYRQQLQAVMRNSYRSHYCRMVPALFDTLEFRSNNDRHQPVIRALALVKKYAASKDRTYPPEENVPLDGVMRSLWQESVQERDKNSDIRTNRITYEIGVLEALRERLRCKEFWVVGANRYRNPDEDLPADFDVRRDEYYAALRLPPDAKAFVARIQQEMREALETLDRGLPTNPHVKILEKVTSGLRCHP